MDTPTAPGAQDIEEGRRRWQRRYDASRRRDADFTTLSGLEVDPVFFAMAEQAIPRLARLETPDGYVQASRLRVAQ